VNCFTHGGKPAVGMCGLCQKGVCRECVGQDAPRLVCAACLERREFAGASWGWYGVGFEYKSGTIIAGWPLVHVCGGFDPVTMRPRIARGIVAIGNIAVGGLAIGGVAFGLVAVGGASIGVLAAVGGFALSAGVSVGGLAIGSIAVGGAAIGFSYAIGGRV
jgi:hypothetical protein